jgi:hypothetical protein
MTVVIVRIILVSSRAGANGADGLVGHGDGELRTLISKTGRPLALSCRVDAASPYRASGLVL